MSCHSWSEQVCLNTAKVNSDILGVADELTLAALLSFVEHSYNTVIMIVIRFALAMPPYVIRRGQHLWNTKVVSILRVILFREE